MGKQITGGESLKCVILEKLDKDWRDRQQRSLLRWGC
jgi:hypothetical protein